MIRRPATGAEGRPPAARFVPAKQSLNRTRGLVYRAARRQPQGAVAAEREDETMAKIHAAIARALARPFRRHLPS